MHDWTTADWFDPAYEWRPLPVPDLPDRLPRGFCNALEPALPHVSGMGLGGRDADRRSTLLHCEAKVELRAGLKTLAVS
jgi:hypothetical protein